MLSFLIHCDGRILRRVSLPEGSHSVGNDVAAALPLLFPTVSRNHGHLIIDANDICHYEDRGSRNGTQIRKAAEPPRALKPFTKEPLTGACVLQLGPFELTLATATSMSIADDESRKSLMAFLRQSSSNSGRALAESELRPIAMQWALGRPWPALTASASLEAFVESGLAELLGDGPLAAHIADPSCLEVLANGPGHLFIDDGGGLRRLTERFTDGASYDAWVQRLVARAGRRLDLQQPLCEGTLPDGSRLQAVLSPVAGASAYVAIRRFTCPRLTEEEALASGWIEPKALRLLSDAVGERRNILVCGGTSSGKTTLLNFLCSYLPRSERIVTIEDTFELKLPLEDVVRLQARRANADGAGAVTARELVQCALRLRPDRIIVGECRGAEVVDMLQAMNTGHPGSMTTIHANSAADALARLEILALTAGLDLPPMALRDWIQRSLDLVVHLRRLPDGRRAVVQIVSYDCSGGAARLLYERSGHAA